MEPRLFVVMVLSNHVAFLDECFQALAAQTDQRFELRLINNGLSDVSTRQVTRAAPSVPMLHNPRPRGWGAVWHQAAQLAASRWGSADDKYLCLLSPDTFPAPECFERLIEYMDAHGNVAMASPILLHLFEEHGADEAWQERVESDHVASAGLMWTRPWRLGNRGVNVLTSEVGDEPLDVDAVAPGCVVIQLSALKESFDVTLKSPVAIIEAARRVRSSGGRCVVVPGATAYRYSGRYRPKMTDRVMVDMDRGELRQIAWRRWRGRS